MIAPELSAEDIAFLREALAAERALNFVALTPEILPPEVLIKQGFIILVSQSIDVSGQDMNYWSITKKGALYLKRLDMEAADGQETQAS